MLQNEMNCIFLISMVIWPSAKFLNSMFNVYKQIMIIVSFFVLDELFAIFLCCFFAGKEPTKLYAKERNMRNGIAVYHHLHEIIRQYEVKHV